MTENKVKQTWLVIWKIFNLMKMFYNSIYLLKMETEYVDNLSYPVLP